MELRTPAQIEADNKAFSALTLIEQRVAVAQDVINQLNSRRLVAESGTYLASQTIREALDNSDLHPSTELQKLFNQMPECDVCAKGALFVCLIDKKNQLQLNEIKTYANGEFDGYGVTRYLEQLFDYEQLELIESAFEQTDMGTDFSDERTMIDAVDFGLNFDNDDERLRAIMENIIENKGEFVP